MMGKQHDTIDTLKKRRAAWAREIGTRSEFAASAPHIVQELDEEIALLAQPLTKEMERRLRDLTARTVINRKDDRIDGDVGL
jgi:hypothetical protein